MSDLFVLMASDPRAPEPPARDRLAAVLLVVAALVVGAALLVGRPDRAGLAARTGAPAWSRPPGEAVAAGRAGSEDLLALSRPANDGGKAVAIWAADGTGPWRQLSDHLSYDSGCLSDGPVCADLLRTGQGLGLFVLRDRPDGRAFLLVQVPAGRTVQVGGRAIGEAAAGRVVQVAPGTPPAVRVTMPDGRQYRLPEMPGTVL